MIPTAPEKVPLKNTLPIEFVLLFCEISLAFGLTFIGKAIAVILVKLFTLDSTELWAIRSLLLFCVFAVTAL